MLQKSIRTRELATGDLLDQDSPVVKTDHALNVLALLDSFITALLGSDICKMSDEALDILHYMQKDIAMLPRPQYNLI